MLGRCRFFSLFVNKFSKNVRDTVLLDPINNVNKLLPRTNDGMRHVCYFRHALALDERRVMFLPLYAYGDSTGPPVTSFSEETIPSKEPSKISQGSAANLNSMINHPHTLEVWFAGTHFEM